MEKYQLPISPSSDDPDSTSPGDENMQSDMNHVPENVSDFNQPPKLSPRKNPLPSSTPPPPYMLDDSTKIPRAGIPPFEMASLGMSQYDIPMCGIPQPGMPLYGIQAPGVPLRGTQFSWKGSPRVLGDIYNSTNTGNRETRSHNVDNSETYNNIRAHQNVIQYSKNNISKVMESAEKDKTLANSKDAKLVQETVSNKDYPVVNKSQRPKSLTIQLPNRNTTETLISFGDNTSGGVDFSSDESQNTAPEFKIQQVSFLDVQDAPSPDNQIPSSSSQGEFSFNGQGPSSSNHQGSYSPNNQGANSPNNQLPFPSNNQGSSSPKSQEASSPNNQEASPPARLTGYRRRSEASINSQPRSKIRKQHIYLTFNCVNNKAKENYFGDIELGSTNCPKVQIWKKCRVNFVEDAVVEVLLEDIFVGMIRLDFTISTFIDLIKSRLFDFDIKVESSRFVLQLFIKKIPLYRPQPKAKYLLQCLFDEIYDLRLGDLYGDTDSISNETPQQVYKKIAEYIKANKIHDHIINKNINVQHPSLKPELRPYQVNSIKWMLHREESACVVELPDDQYIEIELPTGKKIFVNKYSLEIVNNRPTYTKKTFGGILADEMGLGKSVEVFACILNNPRPEGDYLDIHQKHDSDCPELIIQKRRTKKRARIVKENLPMVPRSRKELQDWYLAQLGEVAAIKNSIRKAKIMVECICGDFLEENVVECTDCSKKQHRNCMQYDGNKKDYICPQCWKHKPLLKSKATLIVSPIAICKQWCTEVTTHVRQQGLRVLEYTGVQQGQMIYPTDLLKYDLVVTNYTVLQSELKFTADQSGTKRLRHAKKYFVPVTPLISINWWRLCLDEAQAVESINSNLMFMTLQIPAVHRWAVTGTPIQRNVNDLFGIVQYLQLSPYDDDFQWKNMLYLPYLHGTNEPMLKFLSDIMWRTAKFDVEDQIRIPQQEVKIYKLDFSPIERYTYKSEFEQCSVKFIQNLNKFPTLNITINTLDKSTLNHLMQPLTHLRQTCSHTFHLNSPHASNRKEANSMYELLEIMLKKNKTDCEEHLRTVIACLNGCAGIFLLNYDARRAAKKYLRVLKLIREYENDELIKVDKLQQIHTYYNLLALMEKYNVKIPNIPNTSVLRDKEWSLRREYLRNFSLEVIDSRSEHQKISKVTDEIGSKLLKNSLGWMKSMCDWLNSNGLEKEFANKLYIVVEGPETSRFTWDELMSSLKTWDHRRENCRRTLQNTWETFERICYVRGNRIFADEFVKRASICHLRPDPKSKTRNCIFCKFDRQLSAYECQLFNMKALGEGFNIKTEGTWAMSNKESTMRTLVSFFKTKRGIYHPEVNQAEDYLSYVEAQRREFKILRKLYTQYEQLVSAQDEIHICTIRYRLPDENNVIIKQKITRNQLESSPTNTYEFTNILSPHNLKRKYHSLRHERIAYENLLQQSLAIRRYLKTLENEQSSGEEPSPCPICRSELGCQWCVFSCGHSFCLECLQAMLKRSRRTDKHINCSVCREKVDLKDISYIRNRNEADPPDVPIKGSHPTKIHEIIRLVKKLLADNSSVKIIAFSSRIEVLKRLQEALSLNSISTALVNHYKLHDKLRTFKREDGDINVLLMPMGVGSRGLNLIEATHVILVEPSLTLADELQAIGRIHRIGQTRKTTVHRFIMNESIEESIVNAIEADSVTWADNNSMNLCTLKNLFIMQEPGLANIHDDGNAPPLDSDEDFTDDENGHDSNINPNANEENDDHPVDENHDVVEIHDEDEENHENDDVVMNIDHENNEEHHDDNHNSEANNMLGIYEDYITSSEQSCEEDENNVEDDKSIADKSNMSSFRKTPQSMYRRNLHVQWVDECVDDERTSYNPSNKPSSSSSNHLSTSDIIGNDDDDAMSNDKTYKNQTSSSRKCRRRKYRHDSIHEDNNSSDDDTSNNDYHQNQRPSSSNITKIMCLRNQKGRNGNNSSDDDDGISVNSIDKCQISSSKKCSRRHVRRNIQEPIRNDSDDDDDDESANYRNDSKYHVSSSRNFAGVDTKCNIQGSDDDDDSYKNSSLSPRDYPRNEIEGNKNHDSKKKVQFYFEPSNIKKTEGYPSGRMDMINPKKTSDENYPVNRNNSTALNNCPPKEKFPLTSLMDDCQPVVQEPLNKEQPDNDEKTSKNDHNETKRNGLIFKMVNYRTVTKKS